MPSPRWCLQQVLRLLRSCSTCVAETTAGACRSTRHKHTGKEASSIQQQPRIIEFEFCSALVTDRASQPGTWCSEGASFSCLAALLGTIWQAVFASVRVSYTARGGFLLHDSGSQSVRRSAVQGLAAWETMSNMRSCLAAVSIAGIHLHEAVLLRVCLSIGRATQLSSTRSTRTVGRGPEERIFTEAFAEAFESGGEALVRFQLQRCCDGSELECSRVLGALNLEVVLAAGISARCFSCLELSR